MVHARYAIFALTVTVTYVTMNLTLKFTITCQKQCCKVRVPVGMHVFHISSTI